VPNERAIARVEKGNAIAIPFPSGTKNSAGVSLGLLEHILRIHRYFFRFDDPEQLIADARMLAAQEAGKLLAKMPEGRPASAEDLVVELRDWLNRAA
jgi:hypothetical protein